MKQIEVTSFMIPALNEEGSFAGEEEPPRALAGSRDRRRFPSLFGHKAQQDRAAESMESPHISILVPYRDAQSTLLEALTSVLGDEEPPIEVLAVNDRSTDGGPTLVEALAAKDPRVRSLHSSAPGIVGALRTAAAAARAPILARMDADDVSLPGRLWRQLAFLEAHPEIAVLGTRVENLADAPVGEGLTRYVAWQNEVLTPEDHDRALFVESPLCHPSVMMRRSAYDAVGGYRDARWFEDYDLWLRLWAAGFRLAKLDEVLLRWRHREGRLTLNDPRASEEAFRQAKAAYLAPWIAARGRPLTLWGAGKMGRRFARALEAHGVFASRFVDIDPKKIGGVARGVPIVAASALRAGEETVLGCVGSLGARALIREALDARGFVETVDYRMVA